MSESHDPVAGFDVAALMAPSLRRLGWLAVVIAYLWALPDMATARPFPHWAGLLGPSALLLAGLVSVRGSSSYRASALTLAAGLIAAFGLELAVGHAPGASTMALAAVLVSGVFLGSTRSASPSRACCASAPGWHTSPGRGRCPCPSSCLPGARLPWAGYCSGRSVAASSAPCGWPRRASSARGARRAKRWPAALSAAHLEGAARHVRPAGAHQPRARDRSARGRGGQGDQGPLRRQHLHELRTPLNLIVGFSRMMYRSPEVYGNVRWTARAARRHPRDPPQPAATCSA